MDISQLYDIYVESNKTVIDSRQVEKGDIFFAFSGKNFDASLYANEAIEKGASAVIVENKEFENTKKNIFYSSSTLDVLQNLAKEHRKHLKIPIIGLTGSNGKTTTKELIRTVLAQKFNVQSTHGNLNNHIGVPLTVLSIKSSHEIAVIEMGANHIGEIKSLCEISQPDFGYITNFGKAHLEGFGGFEGVIKAKSELYEYLISNSKYILVNQSDTLQYEKTKNYERKITFGNENSDYSYSHFTINNMIAVSFNGFEVISKLTGDYNFNNISATISLGKYFGVEDIKIKYSIENYIPTNMRSQVERKNDKIFVWDTYNANPSSMEVSLINFSKYYGTKTIIIGDMLELGKESKTEHEKILDLARKLKFEQIISVGQNFKEIYNSNFAFENIESVKKYLKKHPILNKNILLKGSRGIALETLKDVL